MYQKHFITESDVNWWRGFYTWLQNLWPEYLWSTMGTFNQWPTSGKNTIPYLLHANVCLPIVEQIHTD